MVAHTPNLADAKRHRCDARIETVGLQNLPEISEPCRLLDNGFRHQPNGVMGTPDRPVARILITTASPWPWRRGRRAVYWSLPSKAPSCKASVTASQLAM